MSQPESLLEYRRLTNAFYTAYWVSNVSMKNFAAKLIEINLDMDGHFQIGLPPDVDNDPVSELKGKDALNGMKINGLFSQLIAKGLIVWVYALWEDYRKKIAKELDVETNDVCCDLMGDVRIIRNWITHDNAEADAKVSDLKVLDWPNEEGPIVITIKEMQELKMAINSMSVYVKDK